MSPVWPSGDLIVGCALVCCGLVMWIRRRESREGVLLAAAGAIAWAVADLVWWTRGGRRAVVRLPRDPRG